jgi:flagellar biogenesis protein FliO
LEEYVMGEKINGILSAAFILLMFAAILGMAYFATRMIGKGYASQGGASGNIRILDKVWIGRERALLIVRVADKTMLIGMTPHHIEGLCGLDAGELPEPPGPIGGIAFVDALKTAIKKAPDIFSGSRNKEENRHEEHETE